MKKLSRRNFLKGMTAGAAMAAAGGIVPGMGVPNAKAASPNGSWLLVINFRGGYDTLGIFQRDLAALRAKRPTLFLQDNEILSIKGNLGVNSAFPLFKTLYDQGNAAVVQLTGIQNASRSHAEAQDSIVALGVPRRGQAETAGWINRLGSRNSLNTLSVWDFSRNGGCDPATISGPFRGSCAREVGGIGFDQLGNNAADQSFREDLIYGLNLDMGGKRDQAGINGSFETLQELVAEVNNLSIPPANAYPNSSLGRQLRQCEAVLGLSDTTVMFVDETGYDSHSGQRTGMVARLGRVSAALQTFTNRVNFNNGIIIGVTEFGRTTHENGGGDSGLPGTDHGEEFDSWILSPMLNGNVYGPDISNENIQRNPWLTKQDGFVNIVDVYWEIVQRMGYDPAAVFPNHAHAALGMFA